MDLFRIEEWIQYIYIYIHIYMLKREHMIFLALIVNIIKGVLITERTSLEYELHYVWEKNGYEYNTKLLGIPCLIVGFHILCEVGMKLKLESVHVRHAYFNDHLTSELHTKMFRVTCWYFFNWWCQTSLVLTQLYNYFCILPFLQYKRDLKETTQATHPTYLIVIHRHIVSGLEHPQS